MNADKAITVFRELAISSRLNVKLSYWGQADKDVRHTSYQIEIQTPLPPGTSTYVTEIKNRYRLSEMRNPVNRNSGRGTLYLS